MTQFSAQEQLMLELVNRARLDPLAEAARLGIDLNQGLPAGTLDGNAKPVLAPNELLGNAARAHSQHMIDTDQFAHDGIGDGTPATRMEEAGYVFTGNWSFGENIAFNATVGAFDQQNFTIVNHENLFRSPSHRPNILGEQFRELGVGNAVGKFQPQGNPTVFDTLQSTQNFARTGTAVFVTGLCITDADGDNFFDIGEQRAGIAIELRRDGVVVASTSSAQAGGYAAAAEAGACAVRFSGGGLATAVSCTVDTTAGNVKLDLAGANELLCSGDIVLGEGARHATLLGVAALDATGNAAANTLLGNKGANGLIGLDGNDDLRGGNGGDRLQGGAGADRLAGGNGRDILTGGAGADVFDFNTVGEAGKTASSRDRITDFRHGVDRIDLAGIDAVSGGTNDAFRFIGDAPFGAAAGELRFSLVDAAGTANDRTLVAGDIDGDGAGDFQIELFGLVPLGAADFFL